MRLIMDETHNMYGEYLIDHTIARALLNKSDDVTHDERGTYYIRILPSFKPAAALVVREGLHDDEIAELTKVQGAIVRQTTDGDIFVRRFHDAKEAVKLFSTLKKGIAND